MNTLPQLDLAALRAEFPLLGTEANGKPLAYLDNAATSQKPRAVLEALDRYWTTQNANVHRGVHHLSQVASAAYDGTRETVRAFLGAAEEAEVIFTKGCTEGINLVANGLELEAGDRILITTMEHHSNIVPWQIAAQKAGAAVEPIPITDAGEVDLDAYRALLGGGRVKMVGVVHVSNSLGTVNPVKEVAEMAHAHGALVLVDGAQAGPHRRIDVRDLDADFYIFTGHKVYGPTGIGVLYGKQEWLERLPPYQGGGEMIRTVACGEVTYGDPPHRFEAGTPAIVEAVGLGAALRFMDRVGRSRIRAHEESLSAYAHQRLSAMNSLRIIGTAPGKGPILSFEMKGAHAHDVATIIDRQGVAVRAGTHCAMPLLDRFGASSTCRASFGLYNTMAEVDKLAESLEKAQRMFA